MNFKNNLKHLREKKGYSRVEIAKKLNMTSAAYGAYELGNREPKLEKLCEIARLFNTSPNDLLGYTQDSPDDLKNAIDTFRQYGFTVQEGGKDYNGAAREDTFQVTDSKYNHTTPVHSPGDLIEIIDKAAENKYYRQRKADLFHEAIADELTNYFNHREWPKAETIAAINKMFQNRVINKKEKAALLQEVEKNNIHDSMGLFEAFCRLPGKAYDGE